MCLIVLAKNVREDFPFILVGNRDEFFNRPATPLYEWDEHGIIAGRDLIANGTWLGINKKGKFAAITNYRDLKNLKKDAPSRGLLTSEYLKNDLSPEEYVRSIYDEAGQYNGFNLLLGLNDDLVHFSNVDRKITQITEGVHGLSNALLDTSWPKVNKAKLNFTRAIANENIDETELLKVLLDRSMARDQDLPDTGVPKDLERKLSAMFINFPGYGTRCTSVIIKDKNGNISFSEISFNEKGEQVNMVNIRL